MNASHLNDSLAKDSQGFEGETITIDSDFVLAQAFKQAKRHAIDEHAQEITLRIFVMKLEQEVEVYLCLECQTQHERDFAYLVELRNDVEREYDRYEKELYQRSQYPSSYRRDPRISDLEHYLDKLKHLLNNNLRICPQCFGNLAKMSEAFEEPSYIPSFGRQYS